LTQGRPGAVRIGMPIAGAVACTLIFGGARIRGPRVWRFAELYFNVVLFLCHTGASSDVRFRANSGHGSKRWERRLLT
jgi:hypothetical protein